MAKLFYNNQLDQMELVSPENHFETQFAVPPFMQDGDNLTPFLFAVWDSVKFYLFGRFNAKKDMAEFVLAGPPGFGYKISFADGNSPYGWKVKKHGVVRSTSTVLGASDKLIGCLLDRFLNMVGKDSSPDYLRDMIKADAFAMEELIGVPMAMLRISHRSGIMDSREKCIGPWSFYGPSLPEAFCRCRLKVLIYRGPQREKQLRFGSRDDEATYRTGTARASPYGGPHSMSGGGGGSAFGQSMHGSQFNQGQGGGSPAFYS